MSENLTSKVDLEILKEKDLRRQKCCFTCDSAHITDLNPPTDGDLLSAFPIPKGECHGKDSPFFEQEVKITDRCNVYKPGERYFVE